MKNLPAVLLLFALAACAHDVPPPVKVDYDLPPKLNLDVLAVATQDRSRPYGADVTAGGIDLRPTIANAIKDYVTDRIIAIGTTGEAVVTIREASLKLENLPHDSSLFSRPQAAKYVAHAEVEVKVRAREGYGSVTAQASRFETLLQDPTPAERQNAYNAVVNGLMHDLAFNLNTAMQAHLGSFIITAPIMDNPMIPTPLGAPYTYPAR